MYFVIHSFSISRFHFLSLSLSLCPISFFDDCMHFVEKEKKNKKFDN